MKIWETKRNYKGISEFQIPYVFATQCRRPLILQTMNSVRSNNQSKFYQSISKFYKIRLQRYWD